MSDSGDLSAANGSNVDASYFTDSADLTKLLVDKRATDKLQASSYSDANATLKDFAAESDPGAWSSSLDRGAVAQRLMDMVTVSDSNFTDPAPSTGPRSLQQGSLNLCGPTAFFQMAVQRDPAAIAEFAATLYDKGSATLGNMSVSPNQDLLQADFAAMLQKAQDAGKASFTAAEWMLFGALRNSTDVFWQGSWQGDPDQMLSAMTRPEELAGWMRDSGVWSSVEDHGKWATNPGIVNATDLKMYDGTDIALLIHINLIAKAKLWNPDTGNPDEPPRLNPARPDDTFLLSSFPDHWVVLLNEPMSDVKQENVLLAIWTWGQRFYLCVPNDVFVSNYYGAVIGQLKASN